MNMETNEKKKSKDILSVVIILLLVIVLVGLIGFAYARYATRQEGQVTAQIARFNFQLVNGIPKIQNVPNLALTRTDTNQKVSSGMIAPDTHGQFNIGVDATGTQTSMAYEINIAVQNKPTNLHFYETYNETSGYSCRLDDNSGNIRLTGFISLADTKQENKTIYWNWKYETGNTPEEIAANDIIDSRFMGQTSSMDITATGIEVINPKIKTASGQEISLNESNVAQYYGEKVEYIGDGENSDSAKTYRLFYVDFENKYKDGIGTIYLKADWTDNNNPLDTYLAYTSNDTNIMRNMNIHWNIEDGIVNLGGEHVVEYLTDTTQFEKYCNNEIANYAIGGPSIEMLVDSFGQSSQNDYVVDYKNGYYMTSNNGGTSWMNGIALNTSKNGIYAYKVLGNYYWWLCSPWGINGGVCANKSDLQNPRVNNSGANGHHGLCPIVSIKSGTTIQILE